MRRPLFIVGLALLSSAGIALAMWVRSVPVPSAAIPADPTSAAESAALASSNGLAWRDGGGLSLRLRTGEVLTLADRHLCGDIPCPDSLSVQYRYLGWDAAERGYKLAMAGGSMIAPEVVVPFADDAAMIDAGHAASGEEGPLAQPKPPAAAHQDDDLTEWLADITAARAKDEAPYLSKAQGRARRDGARLVLSLDDGRHMVLTDDLACGQVACPIQVFRNFDYLGTSADGKYHVVGEHWDEANAALLVSAHDGAVTPLLGVPSFSPDGKYAVAAVSGLEWTAPRRLEVWNLSGPSPVLDYSVTAPEADDSVYQPQNWTDPAHLRLTRLHWGQDDATGTPVTLVHKADGWHLQGAAAAK